jgi:hypothetical protein
VALLNSLQRSRLNVTVLSRSMREQAARDRDTMRRRRHVNGGAMPRRSGDIEGVDVWLKVDADIGRLDDARMPYHL